MTRLEAKEDLKDKKGERVERKDEWMKMPFRGRESLFIDLKWPLEDNVFKILDTSFEGLCLKTLNISFGRGCIFFFKYKTHPLK